MDFFKAPKKNYIFLYLPSNHNAREESFGVTFFNKIVPFPFRAGIGHRW